MNKIFLVPVLALAAIAVFPGQSSALSCIDPAGMVEHIVSEPDYIVVTAVPVQQKEYVKDAANKDDVNMMYDSGYTGQFIEVKEAHKGGVPDSQWVYFSRNSTWNYLCAGEPPALKSENVYVINFSSNIFEPQTIVAVYPADSKLAKDLIEAIGDAEEIVEPTIYEVPKTDWMARLHDELKEMAFIVKVKLSEWKFWTMKK